MGCTINYSHNCTRLIGQIYFNGISSNNDEIWTLPRTKTFISYSRINAIQVLMINQMVSFIKRLLCNTIMDSVILKPHHERHFSNYLNMKGSLKAYILLFDSWHVSK